MFDPNIIIMLSTIPLAIIFYTVRSRRNTDRTVIKEKFKARLKGTISVTSCFASPFTLLVVPDQINAKYDQDYRNNTSYLALHVNQADARFSVKVGGKKVKIDDFIKKSGNDTSMGIDVGVQQTYWLSYDRERMTVSYGKGYPMNQTTMITFALPQSDKEGDLGSLFAIDDQNSCEGLILLYMKSNDQTGACAGIISKEPLIKVCKEPLTVNPSPLILDADKATLDDLDSGDYMLSSQLPPTCARIFNTIRSLELNPSLINAIRNSIVTEGCILHNILKKKKYLRITIGEEMGLSPGCPFVLEIWPAGATSPIHNHGACCAIVKVLHGSIQCRIYNKMTNPPLPPVRLMEFKASKGEYTWMNEHWYQSHELNNESDDFCATLQCYEYATEDTIHWGQFDYIKDKDLLGFQPGSDLTFSKMKELVLKEFDPE